MQNILTNQVSKLLDMAGVGLLFNDLKLFQERFLSQVNLQNNKITITL